MPIQRRRRSVRKPVSHCPHRIDNGYYAEADDDLAGEGQCMYGCRLIDNVVGWNAIISEDICAGCVDGKTPGQVARATLKFALRDNKEKYNSIYGGDRAHVARLAKAAGIPNNEILVQLTQAVARGVETSEVLNAARQAGVLEE